MKPNTINPNILYYARFELIQNGKKTPKYKAVTTIGYYPPMATQTNKQGDLCLYLMQRERDGENVPSMYLQFQNTSLNFTGLKDYFVGGKMSGFAYGYPYASETYSKDKKPNPFYDYRNDGYLFVIHQTDQPTPDIIELIILENAKVVISAYNKQLQMGGFDKELEMLRKQAYQNTLF